MRTTSLLPAGLVLLALVAPAASAVAADRDPTTADVLFNEGRRAADAGDWGIACAKFEASYRLDPAPGALLNLGDCEEHRKNFARAWQHYRKLADSLPPSDERKALAERLAADVLARSSRIKVSSAGAPATVTLDGAVVARDATVPVEPGAHAIVVRAPQHKPKTYDVVVREGELREVSVTPGDEEGSPTVPPPSSPSSRTPTTVVVEHRGPSAPTIAGWSLVGAGATSLVFATVFGGLALGQESTSSAACVESVCSSQAAVDAHERARSFALVSDVALGLGIALAATAVALVVVGHRSSSVRVGATPGGLWLGGTF